MKKAFILSIFFTVVSIALSLAFKSITASMFSKVDLAVFYSTLDLVGLFMLLFIGFRASMTVAYNKGSDAADILNIFRIILFCVSVIGFAVSVLIVYAFGLGIHISFLFLLFVAFAVYTYFSNQLGMYRLYTDTNVVTILEPLVLIVWFFVLYAFLVGGDTALLYMAASCGMFSIAIYIAISKRAAYPEPKFFVPQKKESLRGFVKNSALGGAEFIFGILILYLAVLFVGKTLSLDALGEFQVVIKSFFMYFISIFVFPIVKFVLSELSHLVAKQEFGRIRQLRKFAFLYAVSSGAIVVCLSFLFGKPLIIWLFGESYAASTTPLWILSIAIFFVTLNTYQVAILKSLDRFFLSMTVRAFGSFIFPVYAFLVYEFLPTLEGVSLALVLSYASMAAVSHYFSKVEMEKLALKD